MEFKKNLTNEAFNELVKENIKNYLPAEYADCNVLLQKTQKNNQVLDALIISRPDHNVAPSIYLNAFYEQYSDGRNLEKILKEIASIRVENEVPNLLDMSLIWDYEQIKDNIVTRIYGVEQNEELLATRPHRTFADDLAVTYAVMMDSSMLNPTTSDDKFASIPVSNSFLEKWDVTEEELFEQATANNKNLRPSLITNMRDIMIESGLSVPPEEVPMYVVSNKDKLYGADALLDNEFLDKVAEKLKGSFYIIPSSIHELIVLPEEDCDLYALECMVKEVNDTEVNPMERLSYSVYYYDAEKHTLFNESKRAREFS